MPDLQAVRIGWPLVRSRTRRERCRLAFELLGPSSVFVLLIGILVPIGPVVPAIAATAGPIAIAAGEDHSAVIRSDGTLWTFGSNQFGQLGTTTNYGSLEPNRQPILVMDGARAVAAGVRHTVVLKTDGAVWTFGAKLPPSPMRNYTLSSPTPTQVLSDALAIAAGADHVIALKSDGTVWTFGYNDFGQLGRPPSSWDDSATPKQVMSGAIAVTAGTHTSTVLKADGTVWSFGVTGWSNNYDRSSATPIWSPDPVQVMRGAGQIASGSDHVVALKSDGTVWTFGYNFAGQIGLGFIAFETLNQLYSVPTQVMSGATAVAAGAFHTIVLRSDGTAWTFGGNDSRQLGVPIRPGFGEASPRLALEKAVAIAGGGRHTIVAKSDGSIWTFGDNAAGQLGRRSTLSKDATPEMNVQPGERLEQSGAFTPVVSARLVDSRPGAETSDGRQAGIGIRAAGSVTEVRVSGRAGIPTSASGVALNVTITQTSDAGFTTVWPCGGDRPNASNINFSQESTVANSVFTGLSAEGTVCIYSDASVHLIVDIAGYFLPSGFAAVSPTRLLDSRKLGLTFDGHDQGGGAKSAGETIRLGVAGRGPVPIQAVAVAVNVAVVDPKSAGFATVWPCDSNRPETSNVNFKPGTTVAAAVVGALGAEGELCLYSDAAADLILDLEGYFDTSSYLESTKPARILDSRNGGGIRAVGSVTELRANYGIDPQTLLFPVADDALAVVMTVTATGAEESGFVTVWPCGSARPNTSTLNFNRAGDVANTIIVEVGLGGKVCLYTDKVVHLIADVAGQYRHG
jgi:alpha-tubulin suppressor-like RCC1 family protein